MSERIQNNIIVVRARPQRSKNNPRLEQHRGQQPNGVAGHDFRHALHTFMKATTRLLQRATPTLFELNLAAAPHPTDTHTHMTLDGRSRPDNDSPLPSCLAQKTFFTWLHAARTLSIQHVISKTLYC